jgi:hypothetical protein
MEQFSHILKGKTILRIDISEDKTFLRFHTSQGDIHAYAYGDCCSNSWVENISLPALGLPATVLNVENIEMPDLGSPEDDIAIKYYGERITTDHGHITIDYRNESNGYYGGLLEWEGGDEYIYQIKNRDEPKVWKEVTT